MSERERESEREGTFENPFAHIVFLRALQYGTESQGHVSPEE